MVTIDEVAAALVGFGKRSTGVLFDELRSKEPRRRANALWLLGRIGGPEIMIQSAYADESREVRLLAAITNARIGREVRIQNKNQLQEAEGDGWVIRDGIVVVLKDAIIPDGTTI